MVLRSSAGIFAVTVAAVALSGLTISHSWGQVGSQVQIEEHWCSEKGCLQWWTLYTVKMEGDTIAIRYRGTDFELFRGQIDEPAAGSSNDVAYRIKGTYTPPPPWCSQAGRSRSQQEKDLQSDRRRFELPPFPKKNPEPDPRASKGKGQPARDNTAYEVKATVVTRLRTSHEKEQRDARVRARRSPSKYSASLEEAPTARFRSRQEQRDQKVRLENGNLGQYEVKSGNIRVDGKSEPHSRGRFMRAVAGTITLGEDTITLDLPPLPVLDHKCTVRDRTEGKLVLKRQYGSQEATGTRTAR